MIEVVGPIVFHADPLHDATRVIEHGKDTPRSGGAALSLTLLNGSIVFAKDPDPALPKNEPVAVVMVE